MTMQHDRQATARIISDLRFRRKVTELYAKGPRVTAELVAEIIAVPLDRLSLEERVDLILAISDEDLEAAGGHKLPPAPLHEVLP